MQTLIIESPIHVSNGNIYNDLVDLEGAFYLGYVEDGSSEVRKYSTINAASYEASIDVMKIFVKAILFQRYSYFIGISHFFDSYPKSTFKGIGWYNSNGEIILSQADFYKGIYLIDGKNYSIYFTSI